MAESQGIQHITVSANFGALINRRTQVVCLGIIQPTYTVLMRFVCI